MIPLKLTLEGIYSYQERQTIDFTALSQAGLFGIFGAVGSGKSSILEAITYALFGETERLNARDKRCLLYTSPSPRDRTRSRMPSSA